ncbi:MAG: hypothetical protein ACK4MV_17190 [Beijerinckiaceae bacterium]
MLYVDIPTIAEIGALARERASGCVSFYLPATAQTQHVGATRTALKNLAREADRQLEASGFDKRMRAAIAEHVDDILDDDEFWKFQSNSVAILVTPESARTYRLPNKLSEMVEVSDRFHLKPLLRAVTFPHHAFVLALSEDRPRLIEMTSDMPAEEVRVRDMPRDAGSATGRASINDRSPSGRIHGSEGQKVLMRQYCRKVDAALRPLLAGRHEPLIVVAAEPLLGIWRSVNSYAGTAGESLATSPAAMSAAQLADAARPVLDRIYAAEIAEFAKLYADRMSQGRATADMASAARAATAGAIDTLLVDIDEVVPGFVDEQTGAITLSDSGDAKNYGVVDEIAGRVLLSGGRVLGVRKQDIPGGGSLAAVLRYAV